MKRKITKDMEKICNICGEGTLKYTVEDNAPLCKDCRPPKKKKVSSESNMLRKILEGEKIK